MQKRRLAELWDLQEPGRLRQLRRDEGQEPAERHLRRQPTRGYWAGDVAGERGPVRWSCVDAFNRRDLGRLCRLTDDEMELESRLVGMEGGSTVTRTASWWQDFLGAFPDYALEIEELRDLGDVTLGHHARIGDTPPTARTPLVDPFWMSDEVAGRQGRFVAQLLDRGRSPRSRGAVGVGDVAGERGGRPQVAPGA